MSRPKKLVRPIAVVTTLAAASLLSCSTEETAAPQTGMHLEPCPSALDAFYVELEYQRRVRATFDLNPPERPAALLARMICLPPFDPEWVVSVYGPRGRPAIVELQVPENLGVWGINHPGKDGQWLRDDVVLPPVESSSCSLPRDVAESIGQFWERSLLNTRYPADPPNVVYVDSIHYVAVRDGHGGSLCGRTRKPPPGSPMESLVTIAHLLADHVRSCDSGRDVVGELKAELGKLDAHE